MKNPFLRIFSLCIAVIIFISILSGCSENNKDDKTDTIDATPIESVDNAESSSGNEDNINKQDIYKHVVLIGVDGGGAFFEKADMPRLNEIMSNGTVTYRMLTSNPTISAQCWGSMLTGVIPEVHHFTNSRIEDQKRDSSAAVPSVFRVIREQLPDAVLASFCNWNPINIGIIENDINVYMDSNSSDDTLSEMIANYVSENKPTFLFVQFDQVDGAGHTSGYGSDAYFEQLNKTDEYIGRIYDAYVNSNIIDETLFIVTADHGGKNQGHGGWTNEEKYVMFAIKGKTVLKNSTIDDMAVRDTPAIILHALGLDNYMPVIWTARIPSGIFEGIEATERKSDTFVFDIAHRTHQTEATPEIGSGNSIVDALGSDRLLAYFPFDGNEKDALEKTDTEVSGKLYFPDAFYGEGAQFDDGYIKLLNFAPGTDSFSVGFWMNTPGTTFDPVIIGNKRWAAGANPGFALILDGTELKFNVGDKKNRMDLVTDLPADYCSGWTYVTLIVDRENARIGYSFDFEEIFYLDIPDGFVDYDFNYLLPTCIGQDGTGNYRYKLPGTFDEFFIANGVITQDDISAIENCYVK